MTASDTISILALLISVLSFIISFRIVKRQIEMDTKIGNYTTMIEIENRLKDMPNALRFHGIDPAELTRVGIDVNEFVYLLNSFSSGSMFYQEGELANDHPFKENTYRHTMLSHPEVRKAWPYLRKMIEPSTYRRKIENTIAVIEKSDAEPKQ